MPIYEYRRPDGTTFEVLQSFNDESLKCDPETGVPVQRVLHAPAVHFKGSGFYNTDYGTRKRQRENQSETAGSVAGEGSDKTPAAGAKDDAAGSKETAPAKQEQGAVPKKAEPVAAK